MIAYTKSWERIKGIGVSQLKSRGGDHDVICESCG